MRYKITIIPFLDDVHITIAAYGEEIGTRVKAANTFIMTSEEGQTDKLWDVLSWLAGEVAATDG
jgi:hypothetical protein